jgi:hypothetical protein
VLGKLTRLGAKGVKQIDVAQNDLLENQNGSE